VRFLFCVLFADLPVLAQSQFVIGENCVVDLAQGPVGAALAPDLIDGFAKFLVVFKVTLSGGETTRANRVSSEEVFIG
jgi:hypothetical protein